MHASPFGREFDGIGEQVPDDLLKPGWISSDRPCLRIEDLVDANVLGLGGGLHRFHRPLDDRAQIDPLHINLSPARPTVDSIRQTYITVDEEKKFELLLKVFERERPRQCIIFVQRKRWADRL